MRHSPVAKVLEHHRLLNLHDLNVVEISVATVDYLPKRTHLALLDNP